MFWDNADYLRQSCTVFLVILSSTKCTHCQIIKSSHTFQQNSCTLLLQFQSMRQNKASVSLDLYRTFKERHSSCDNSARYKVNSSNTDQGLLQISHGTFTFFVSFPHLKDGLMPPCLAKTHYLLERYFDNTVK